MEAAKEPKEAASACLDKIELDPEKYRIGHTKASKIIMIEFFFSLQQLFKLFDHSRGYHSPVLLVHQFQSSFKFECVFIL